MRTDSKSILFDVDHKKNGLPTFFRDDQSQCFGKKGLSLIGLIAIYRVRTHFYYVVIDGYSTQDALQMITTIFYLRKIIAEDNPSVEQIVLKSDNFSGYACAKNFRTTFR